MKGSPTLFLQCFLSPLSSGRQWGNDLMLGECQMFYRYFFFSSFNMRYSLITNVKVDISIYMTWTRVPDNHCHVV